MDVKTIAFWALSLIFVAPGFYFGFAKLIATPDKIIHFQRLGISIPIMRILGFFEIASGIALLVPKTRLIGMAAWAIILLGANYYNVTKNEPKDELMASIGVSVLLVLIFWLNA